MTGRAEWLAARRTGIGGSDIGAILGLSPYKSSLDVYLDKRGELARETGNEQAMYWGTVLEDVVAREYATRTQRAIQRVNAMLRHPGHDFMLANLDRAVVNPDIAGRVTWNGDRLTTDRILECKTANSFAAAQWGEPGSDSVPDAYLLQCQWYLGVTGAQIADLAVLIGGSDYRIYSIERNDGLIGDMIEAAAEFWKRVQNGQPPDPTTSADARRLWPSHIAGKSVIVDVGIANDVAALAAGRARVKEWEAELDAAEARILAAFGDAEEISHMGKKLATWKANKPTVKTDWKGLAADYADYVAEPVRAKLHAAHTETKPGARVLRLAKGA